MAGGHTHQLSRYTSSVHPRSRLANLRAALGFLQLLACEPELQPLHRWMGTLDGGRLITGGRAAVRDGALPEYGGSHGGHRT